MDINIGWIAIIIGFILTCAGYGSLFFTLKTNSFGLYYCKAYVCIAFYTLVVGGLLIIILGFLYLMGIIPWYWASGCDNLIDLLI